MTTIALDLEDKQSLIELEKCDCFIHFIYKYDIYCHKVHISFSVSHGWHIENMTLATNF